MIVAWDDRASTADTDQHDDTGLCPGCGEFYTASEWKSWQCWQNRLMGEELDQPDGTTVPLSRCCSSCADAYFAPDGDNPQY